MADYKVVDTEQLETDLTTVADSIRAKAGTEDKLAFPEGMKEAVDGLNTFTPPSSMALDPDEVYRTTRPKDWLPMPTPGDDEIYLLNLIPEGLDGAFTAQITFSGTCTVDFGNLVDGVFVAKETVTPTSGTKFFHTVYWDDYGDETSERERQYLVRIHGEGIDMVELLSTNLSLHSEAYICPVDAVVGMTVDFRTEAGAATTVDCATLRYVRFVGNGRMNYTNQYAYRYCGGLRSISSENPAKGTTMGYSFTECKSLLAISKNMFLTDVSYKNAFADGAFAVPADAKIRPTEVQYCWGGCASLTKIDGNQIDTSLCANFTGFVQGSSTLRIVTNLNISSMTTTASMFKNANIAKLTFAGETTPGGWTIDCSTCIMSHKALVNMINSLPTALSPATITITNNPGAAELTDEEIAIATARNWTVTI